MSIAGATVFEIRPGGIDTNGGGYVPGSSGTDWTQQDSPQYSVTDGVAVGTTTITSATAAFGTDVVGNIANIGGVWRQIISRTNSTTIVVDSNVTSGTGLTIKIGGGFATPTQAISVMITTNTAYCKGATYALTSALTIVNANQLLTFIGYTSSRTDGGQATWTTSTNSVGILELTQAAGIFLHNIKLTCTAGTKGIGIGAKTTNNSGFISLSNCVIDGFATGILADFNVNFQINQLFLHSTEIKNCTLDGVNNAGSTHAFGCYIHDNGRDGIRQQSGNTTQSVTHVAWSILKSNGAAGLSNQGTQSATSADYKYLIVQNCAIINNVTDGITSTIGASTVGSGIISYNTIYDSNGGYGINTGPSNNFSGPPIGACNAFRSNTSGARNVYPVLAGDITLTADPFTNRSGGDFSLNSTTGGGAACKGAGFPGVLQIGGTGSLDIGPLQSGGGGGTVIVVNQQQTNYIVREDPWY